MGRGILYKTMVFALVCAITSAEIIGGYTTDYLDYGVGARYLAMGGAGRTIATDANAGYWNPALLPQVLDLSFSGMSSVMMGMTQYNQFSMSVPLSRTDVIAGTYLGMGLDSMELHLAPVPSSTPEGTFDVKKSAIMLSYGHKMSDNLNVGLTAKYGSRKVYLKQDAVMAVDVGAWMDLGNIQCGGTVRNAYATMMGDKTDDKYEMDVDLGASMRMDAFLLSLDVGRIMRKNFSYYIGAEYDAFSVKDSFDLKLRGGVNSNELSMGLGVCAFPIMFDYAFLIRSTSQEQLFSLGLVFDENTKKQKMLNAEKWYQKALLAADANEFGTAKVYAKTGLDEYQDLFVLKQLSERLDFVIALFDQGVITDENGQRLLKDSVRAFLKQDWEKSLDIAEYLARKYDTSEIYSYRSLLEAASKRISKNKGKDIVRVYQEEAMGALMVDDMKSSNKKLEQLLYFEPDNILALKRLGSNYYVSGQIDQALQIWKHVLVLDPNDKEVNQLMKKVASL